MDRTVGTIAALTGASIVFICLQYLSPMIEAKNKCSRNGILDGNCGSNSNSDEVFKCRYERESNCITHRGGCHCGRIRFQIDAPPVLHAVDVTSKIRYPRVSVPCSKFSFLTDQNGCSLYSVEGINNQQGVHTFCSFCGVHVLFAPSTDPHTIHVNTDCLDMSTVQELKVSFYSTLESLPCQHLTEETLAFNRRGSGWVDPSALQTVNTNITTSSSVVITESSYTETASYVDSYGQPPERQQLGEPAAIQRGVSPTEDQTTVFSTVQSKVLSSGLTGYTAAQSSNDGLLANRQLSPTDDETLWSAVVDGFYETSRGSSRKQPLEKRFSSFNKDSYIDPEQNNHAPSGQSAVVTPPIGTTDSPQRP